MGPRTSRDDAMQARYLGLAPMRVLRQMRRVWYVAGCTAAIVCLIISWEPSQIEQVRTAFDKLLLVLGSDAPGHGFDVLDGEIDRDYSMAYAMAAIACSRMYSATQDQVYLNIAVTCADWLADHRDLDADAFIGWGLPITVATDAGEYPAFHEYNITTAFAILGLTETAAVADSVHELSQQAAEYRSTALAAAITLIERGCFARFPDGGIAFWYSCMLRDEDYIAPNVTAVMSAALCAAAAIAPAEQASVLRALADGGVRFLLSAVRVGSDGSWSWDYRVGETVQRYTQDLVHSGYTAWGLAEYAMRGGALASRVERKRIVAFLDHYKIPSFMGRSRLDSRQAEVRLWDVAFEIAARARWSDSAPNLRGAFHSARLLQESTGTFRFSLSDASFYVRAEAAMLLGLADYYVYLIGTG